MHPVDSQSQNDGLTLPPEMTEFKIRIILIPNDEEYRYETKVSIRYLYTLGKQSMLPIHSTPLLLVRRGPEPRGRLVVSAVPNSAEAVLG